MLKTKNVTYISEGFEVDGKMVPFISLEELDYFCKCYPEKHFIVSDYVTEDGKILHALPVVITPEDYKHLYEGSLLKCFTSLSSLYLTGDHNCFVGWKKVKKVILFCEKSNLRVILSGNEKCGISTAKIKITPHELIDAFENDLDILMLLRSVPIIITEKIPLLYAKKIRYILKCCNLNFIEKDAHMDSINKVYFGLLIFSLSSFAMFVFLAFNFFTKPYK